jgi:DNA invertase Pin-like site-specific DNA recombinase
MPKAAAIYCRISEDRTGEQAGVERQLEDCRALAERRGWPVADVYLDNDVSAYSGRPRPQYRRLLEDVKSGVVDAVVVWHLDRLHRHPRELEDFFEVVDAAGLRDMASVSGDVDLGTDDGRFHARILGAVARKESDDKSRRIRRKHEQLARAGQGRGGGTRPFGFASDRITVREDEAKLIREAAGRVLLGESLRSVCRTWTERGVTTPAGKAWTSNSLRRLLMSGRVAGLREHHGEVVAVAVWEGILDRATHERLRSLLQDPGRLMNGGSNRRKYLLTGILHCGLCGARLVARPRSADRPAYVCATGPNFSGCGKIRSLAKPLEQLVAEAVFAALDSRTFAAALRAAGRNDDEAGILEQIRIDEQSLEQLALDHYVERVIDRPAFLAAKAALESRLSASRRALSRHTKAGLLVSLPSGSDALRAAWESHDTVWRRALVGAVLERVVLRPAVKGRNRFDPERVDLVWRV